MISRRVLRTKVVKALYAHLKSDGDSLVAAEKLLFQSVDQAYDLYLQLLRLPVELKRYALQRIELARVKKLATAEDLNPNLKFVENKAIAALESDETLAKRWGKRTPTLWTRYPELVKNLFNALTASKFYEAYMADEQRSYKQDAKLLEKFYERIVADSEPLDAAVEEQSILWADDVEFAVVLAVRTMGDMRDNQAVVPILPPYKNDGDKRFAKELLRRSIVDFDANLAYVEQFTQNWDVERIAFLDTLTMVVATAELIHFEEIPVSVTLDEYLEIAKYYSTPGSALFINGILDKVVEQLRTENKLIKTGRGLL